MDAHYELGRYMKKVADQEKEIRQLQETIESYESLIKANNAIVAAVVKVCGEVCVNQADINSALSEELGVITNYDAEARTYILRPEVNTNGEGTG